ncbi:hypothetical protein ABZ464_23655 [Streptomyces sp. NPDC005820]|uniref:hypothetical protein n=1 Tax=Streptomyces sp. NPDC005820 TaxID=3157069 RepID=UPI0033FD5F93
MSTTRLDHFAAHGTGPTFAGIRLADGQRITVQAGPGAQCLPYPNGGTGPHSVPSDYAGPYTHLEVYLGEGIEPGNGDGWDEEDSTELWLTAPSGTPDKGRLFYEVPVEDVRALIEEHGGEHAEQGSEEAGN